MRFIIDEVNNQLDNIVLNNETLDNLNKFFDSLNEFLKGSHDSLIFVFKDSIGGGIYSNILDSQINFYRLPIHFKKVFNEFILNFIDDKELFLDIVFLLNEFNLFELTHNLRTHLFKVLFKSGYFCYVPLNKEDFIRHYDYIKFDLKVICNIVSCPTLKDIDLYLNETMRDLYLFEDIDLKYILLA